MREFRGTRYLINVIRVGKGNSGKVKVDGQEIEGTVVPAPAEAREEVYVEVRLGTAPL